MFSEDQREATIALLGKAAEGLNDDQLLEALLNFAEDGLEENARIYQRSRDLSATLIAIRDRVPTGSEFTPAEQAAMVDAVDGELAKIDRLATSGQLPEFIADQIRSQLEGDKPSRILLAYDGALAGRPIDWVLGLFESAVSAPERPQRPQTGE